MPSCGPAARTARWRSSARARGLEIGCLVNVIDAETRRVRFHATRAELIAAQAAALGIPLRQLATSWPDFEASLQVALAALAADGYAGVILGDIHLADVRAWYGERVRAAGLEHVEPLWGDAPLALVREYTARGGRAVILRRRSAIGSSSSIAAGSSRMADPSRCSPRA